MPKAGINDHELRLNRCTPADADAKTGTVLKELLAAHNDLAAKFAALLAHMDAGGVGGNNNVAMYTPAYPVLLPLGAR